MSIPDPCGIEYGYQRIVAIWVKYIMVGINYYNKDVLRSNTVRGYALAVNTLFRLRGYEPPTDMSNRNNMPGIVINNLIKQEDVELVNAPHWMKQFSLKPIEQPRHLTRSTRIDILCSTSLPLPVI